MLEIINSIKPIPYGGMNSRPTLILTLLFDIPYFKIHASNGIIDDKKCFYAIQESEDTAYLHHIGNPNHVWIPDTSLINSLIESIETVLNNDAPFEKQISHIQNIFQSFNFQTQPYKTWLCQNDPIKFAELFGNSLLIDPKLETAGAQWWTTEDAGGPPNLSHKSLGDFFLYALKLGAQIGQIWPFSAQYPRSTVHVSIFMTEDMKNQFEQETRFRFKKPKKIKLNNTHCPTHLPE